VPRPSSSISTWARPAPPRHRHRPPLMHRESPYAAKRGEAECRKAVARRHQRVPGRVAQHDGPGARGAGAEHGRHGRRGGQSGSTKGGVQPSYGCVWRYRQHV
jgi:hypothetical protein